jgi:hypothetical protein
MKHTPSTIDRAITLYALFNRYQEIALPFYLLRSDQREGWIAVAKYMANDRSEIRMMENTNTELRDTLWSIMQQCADQLDIQIDGDRY